MKMDMLEKTIRAEIARLKRDERYSYPPAQVQINAPLALIQVDLKARVQALEWALRRSVWPAAGQNAKGKKTKKTKKAAQADQKELEIAELEANVATLKKWVNDLHSGMYINCVYCGHRYGPRKNTPVAMSEVLKKHIRRCPDHPLSQATDDIEYLLQFFLKPGTAPSKLQMERIDQICKRHVLKEKGR